MPSSNSATAGVSPFESKLIVTGGYAGDIRITNAYMGNCVEVIPIGFHINKLQLSTLPGHGSGSTLAVAGNGWIRLYDLGGEETSNGVRLISLLEGHSKNITSISFDRTNESKWFLSTGEDGKILLWDRRAKGFQTSISHSSSVLCGTVGLNNSTFLFGDEEHYLNEWDLAMNRVVRTNVTTTTKTTKTTGIGVSGIAVNPTHTYVVHGNNRVSAIPNESLMTVYSASPTIPNFFGTWRSETVDSNFEDMSPSHAMRPPIISSPMAAAFKSFKNDGWNNLNGHHVVLNNTPRIPQSSQTFANDVYHRKYITSIKLSTVRESMNLTGSDGSLSVWSARDSTWSIDCILREGTDVPVISNAWCWDSAFVFPQDTQLNKYIISAYSDGTCKLWDSNRPASAPVASYDCGDGKCIKSVLVLESSSTNLVNTPRRFQR